MTAGQGWTRSVSLAIWATGSALPASLSFCTCPLDLHLRTAFCSQPGRLHLPAVCCGHAAAKSKQHPLHRTPRASLLTAAVGQRPAWPCHTPCACLPSAAAHIRLQWELTHPCCAAGQHIYARTAC